ncbi:DUF4391 domain-containing protein [Agromyces badenianii]|uniref:DUF4391 domain-containing protein n=1 Tax=Agromyces badenianii TaxID=2080742 RepID=UPI0014048780|nr:DUF4391 domain-containing protein [Agromyces badenianii]
MTGNPFGLADLLGLPERARESRRLTKKDIVAQWEQAAPPDARLLTRAIASATIVGVLSPATVGAPAFQDLERRVDMIPIVEVTLVERMKPAERTRVAELLHRSMPRPSVIGLQAPDSPQLISLALTRLSRTDEGMSVVEAHLFAPFGSIDADSLHVMKLERSDLDALYRDLVRTAAADGVPASPALTAAEAVGLRQRLASLESELSAATRDAAREKSMQRRIEINTRARTLRTQISQVRSSLYREVSGESQTTDEPKVGQ